MIGGIAGVVLGAVGAGQLGFLFLLIGIGAIIVGVGLWQVKKWSWLAAVIIGSLNAITNVLTLGVLGSIIQLIIQLGILGYLISIKDVFVESEP